MNQGGHFHYSRTLPNECDPVFALTPIVFSYFENSVFMEPRAPTKNRGLPSLSLLTTISTLAILKHHIFLFSFALSATLLSARHACNIYDDVFSFFRHNICFSLQYSVVTLDLDIPQNFAFYIFNDHLRCLSIRRLCNL